MFRTVPLAMKTDDSTFITDCPNQHHPLARTLTLLDVPVSIRVKHPITLDEVTHSTIRRNVGRMYEIPVPPVDLSVPLYLAMKNRGHTSNEDCGVVGPEVGGNTIRSVNEYLHLCSLHCRFF